MEEGASAEALIPLFELSKVLNQDQGGRRATLYGTINAKPAILTIERHAFPSGSDAITSLLTTLVNVQNLEANDIYAWYLGNIKPTLSSPDVKIDLIYPCTEKHVKKYSPQITRVVTETPEVYRKYVRPYMQKQREGGKLNWVFNIIEGRKEQDAVILRESRNLGHDPEGFLLLPDMNWDRKTMSSLRILVLVERRDLWSLRDLKKTDVPWLKHVQSQVLGKVGELYGVEGDELKLYMHYQPTHYHFHIHVTSTSQEPLYTSAAFKAFPLPNIIAQLETLGPQYTSLADTSIIYTIGEYHELWNDVFFPIKKGKIPQAGDGETGSE